MADSKTLTGEQSLNLLRATDPVQYLSPSPELSRLARTASSYLYSSLIPFCPTKPPLEQLLSDEQFDAEQIWGQIDLLSKPLLPFIKRQISRLEKEEPKLQSLVSSPPPKSRGKSIEDEEEDDYESEEEDEEEEGVEEEDNNGELGEEDDLEGESEEEEEEGERKGVEDKFLKIKDLEKFLEEGEAEEYGDPPLEKNENKKSNNKKNYEDESDEEEDEDEEDEEGFTFGDMDDEDGEEADQAEDARYEDFFVGKSNKGASKKKVHFKDELEDLELEDFENQDNQDNQENQENDDISENDNKILSTHEKEMQKLSTKIEEMERANLEPKTWTMQGEVSAAKRPKNSALEVDLDFEHNMRPAPVITEEVTASLEEIIKKRIIDANFDDVEKAPVLPTKTPKELKELDENKSKKGLAELYEEDYAQKAGLAPVALSASDELKKEADMIFKKICLKLDALSHFHFAPKPVIEDMSVQVNVPALAMEEIAPVAVSDAAMLAPEEIFEGKKGNFKEEKELSQSEKKRRRANKKRKFKAESTKREAKKPRETTEA